MGEDRKLPVSVNVDIGARAEIRTEIPSSSSGRLLDALTDVLRPFSEARGLRADQIRLQREDVLIQIAHKAKERLAIENAETHPIPNNTLVPLLEKASLEDPSDKEMIDRWANLLALESSSPGPNRRWCIEILAAIDSAEAQLLDEIWYEHTARAAYDFDNFTSSAAERDFERMASDVSQVTEKETKQILSAYYGMSWFFHGDNIAATEEFSVQDLPWGVHLLHLRALGLIWVNASALLQEDIKCFVLNAKLSPLGYEFVRICRGKEI